MVVQVEGWPLGQILINPLGRLDVGLVGKEVLASVVGIEIGIEILGWDHVVVGMVVGEDLLLEVIEIGMKGIA